MQTENSQLEPKVMYFSTNFNDFPDGFPPNSSAGAIPSAKKEAVAAKCLCYRGGLGALYPKSSHTITPLGNRTPPPQVLNYQYPLTDFITLRL
jgi:hypothetical protein